MTDVRQRDVAPPPRRGRIGHREPAGRSPVAVFDRIRDAVRDWNRSDGNH
ncbi:hypothetical protein HC028_15590 [Planosporangium flavigriseum]|nr:hypothetical protein [Planosporangium flavigriseum]NJC65914.1 hypothetical protein [Planosporangium flavigriseum]